MTCHHSRYHRKRSNLLNGAHAKQEVKQNELTISLSLRDRSLKEPRRHTNGRTNRASKKRLWRGLSKCGPLGALRVQRRNTSCRNKRAVVPKSDLRTCNRHFRHGRARCLLVRPNAGRDHFKRSWHWPCL